MVNKNLNLIKLYSACAKQTAAVMTVNNVCSMLAVQTLSDLVLQFRVDLLFTLNKFIMKSFLV